MFANEDEGFQELFGRLLAYSSTKQSIKMSKIKKQNRRDDPMEVDALSCRVLGTVASLATTRRTVNISGHRTKNGRERKARA